ncbi:MAG TPA: protease inhibitor I42 family protein [Longimicrobium sp.]
MNARLLSTALAVALLACAQRPAPQPPASADTQPSSRDAARPPAAASDTSKRILAAPGDTFFVTLRSNATTGYQWRLADSPDARVITFVGKLYVPDPNPQRMVGVGGVERWAFAAVAPGMAEIALEYARPGGPPATEQRFYVLVR